MLKDQTIAYEGPGEGCVASKFSNIRSLINLSQTISMVGISFYLHETVNSHFIVSQLDEFETLSV